MSGTLSGAHSLSKVHADSVDAGNHSRCFVISKSRDTRLNLCLKRASVKISSFSGHKYYSEPPPEELNSTPWVRTVQSNRAVGDSDSDSDSEREPEADPNFDSPSRDSASLSQEMKFLKEAVSPVLSDSSGSLEPESWTLIDGEDVPTVVSSLPMTKRYAPRRLLEFVAKNVDPKMFSPEQLKKALMFWQKKEKLEEDSPFAPSAFGEKGVSQIYQWTATELTLQHARLTRIARDVLYLVLACSLLGFVRVLEALSATFSTRPPHFSRLLDAANSLDFFTMAFLAYSVRKPIIGILRVDPTNLDEVVHLKAKIWDEMHKFYERQWKLIATLAVGRLLALITQKLPSTNVVTRNIKMCWDFLLALPIF